MRASKPVQVREPEPELVSAVEPLALAQAAALVQVREPEPVRAQQLAQARVLEQQSELAAVPKQERKLRVSRQLELQQHRLPTAAQERPPYLPVLPMKAPC